MKKTIILTLATIFSVAMYSQVTVTGSNGYTTVGSTDAALSVLDIRAADGLSDSRLSISKSTSGYTSIYHYGNKQLNFGAKEASNVRFMTNDQFRMTIFKGGTVRVDPGSNFTVLDGDLKLNAGNAFKTGSASWSIISDARLKQNVESFDMGLDAIMKVKPVTYNYNEKSMANTEKNHVGIIAQDVEKIAPFMVNDYELKGYDREDEEVSYGTYKSVDPDAFVYMLINGMQEQQELIETLQNEVENLKSAISNTNIKNANTNVNLIGSNVAKLGQNIPNPFSTFTKIEYFVPANASNAKVVFTNLNGNVIKTIEVERGNGTIDVSVEGLSSGVYTYSLIVDGLTTESKRMIVE